APSKVQIPFDCTGLGERGVPPDDDLIAAADRTSVSLGRTNGTVVAELEARAPVGFSVSGILATGNKGEVWFPDGSPWERGEVQISIGSRWGWSPVADCAATISKEGGLDLRAFLGIPPGTSARLIDSGVESFSFSPSGRLLAAVRRVGARVELWVIDLSAEKARMLKRFPSGVCCVTLGGWTPPGNELLFWAGSGSSVMADGWPLRGISVTGKVSRYVATRVRSEFLVRCSDRLLAIVGGDRFDVGPMHISEISPGKRESQLTSAGNSYFGLSCAPSGSFIAAARAPVIGSDTRLDEDVPTEVVILNSSGDVVQNLTPEGVRDTGPDWAGGKGLIFVRTTASEPQLWYIPEGGTARSIGVSLGRPAKYYRGVRWSRFFDWSATP
ncbi:MAG: hypothetical protein LC808_20800, partial [Actinobacteria bacterium]|nr:hypothetical protein [Actinomycetota bacterium]